MKKIGYCPLEGSMKVSLKTWDLHWEEFREAEKRTRFHYKVIRGRGLVVDSKSKVERVISFTIPAAIF